MNAAPRHRLTWLRTLRRAAAATCLIWAALGCSTGCAFPLYTLFAPGEPTLTADDFPQVDGWKPELKLGASYPGPIPRPVLEQRLKGVVRIEVRENFLRNAGRQIGAAATPVGRPDYALDVGALVWYSLRHQLHPAPYRVVGSGFFVREGGYIATNDHVIEMPGDLVVKTWDGRIYPARRLGRDPVNDLAVLKIEPTEAYPVLPLGDSNQLLRGDYLMAVGHPFGFDLTLTQGIVSGLHRAPGVGPFDWMIQTDADINPGNSGGPLLNAAGEVVGVNEAAFLWGSKAGFALPVDLLGAHLDTLILGYTPEPVRPPAYVETVDDRARQAARLPVWSGVIVWPAMTGYSLHPQLQAGDLLLEADGLPLHTNADFYHALALKEPYDTLTLRLLRPVAPPERTAQPTAQAPDPHPGWEQRTIQLQLQPAD